MERGLAWDRSQVVWVRGSPQNAAIPAGAERAKGKDSGAVEAVAAAVWVGVETVGTAKCRCQGCPSAWGGLKDSLGALPPAPRQALATAQVRTRASFGQARSRRALLWRT